MGKNRHTKDKLWISYSEHINEWGGKKPAKRGEKFQKLPFYCCALSLLPFSNPVCTKEGTVFDLVNIIPYVKKFKKNPVTGQPLALSDLIKLNFHKNAKGEYHCPVTYNVFTEFSHIIAIPETGNVYSYEAYEQLNKQPKHYFDLMNGAPFDPKKVITIQDPKGNKKNVFDFEYMKKPETVDFVKSTVKDRGKVAEETINLSEAHKRILSKLKQETIKEEKKETGLTAEILEKNDFRVSPKDFVKLRQAARKHEVFTEGKTAPSMTSTTLNTATENKFRSLTADEIRNEYYQLVKSRQLKGYAKIQTNIGPLNFEIYAHLAPRASENFLELLENGYYHHTKFHRLIPEFMVQGGDPEGSGKGGDSYFGGTFPDEFTEKLSHNSRGILSMANAGPNTNRSQFFITFDKCQHLDNKHTVFGRLVGGMATLDAIEAIPTEEHDRPKSDIEIVDSQIFVNPFRDVIQEILRKEGKKQTKVAEEEKVDVNERWFVQKKSKTEAGEVGKYLKGKDEIKRTITDSKRK